MHQLNLCLLCRDIGGDVYGGLATSTCDLAEALAVEGHTVHVIAGPSRFPARALRDVTIRRVSVQPEPKPLGEVLPQSPAHDLLHAAAAYREVRRIHEDEQAVDAVLAPLWRSEGVVCALDDRFPTIVSCMTSLRTLAEIDPLIGQLPDIEARIALERAGLQRGRYLHGLTQAVLTKTIRDYALEPELTAVVGRGLRDRRGAPAAVRNGPLALLFLGRLEHRKGVDALLDAVAQLIGEGISLQLTLAGPEADPQIAATFALRAATDARLRTAVRFVGAVSDTERDRLLGCADVVCCPSRYESHGIVLLEAMMFGRAIVTCDAGGIGEVVRPGESALICPPGDPEALAGALRQLAGDDGLRTRLGIGARRAYEQRHTARPIALRMQRLMTDVLAAHRRAATATAEPSRILRASGEIRARLSDVIDEVLDPAVQNAPGLAAELLDPVMYDPRTVRRLRAEARRARPARSPSGSGAAPRVTAVVLTSNRPRRLAAALESLQESELAVRTLVFDNGSAPRGGERVAAECASRPGVELHRLERNLGCAGGRRLGAERADTELILFFDDDVELLPGAVDHLVSELDGHPEAGAVTATVVTPDGLVQHSGGTLECHGGVATFTQIGSGCTLDSGAVPPSGRAGWVPGTAVLMRRELLRAFPIDDEMTAYFEDNEWCYRVAQSRPDAFRRSREALALHHLQAKDLNSTGSHGPTAAVAFLHACAHFYTRHGLLLAPETFVLVPELGVPPEPADLSAARLLMELVAAKGVHWTAHAWSTGEFESLVNGQRWRSERRATRLSLTEQRSMLAHAQASLTGLTDALASRDAALAAREAELAASRAELTSRDAELLHLRSRHETLCRIEQGGWWRLRSRILPLVRLASRLRAPDHPQPPLAGPAVGRSRTGASVTIPPPAGAGLVALEAGGPGTAGEP